MQIPPRLHPELVGQKGRGQLSDASIAGVDGSVELAAQAVLRDHGLLLFWRIYHIISVRGTVHRV